ncbi:MAG: MFS transporter [Rhizobiales bacterium]|nr:MFS transporter [Hyphomicrobiales bacterium]
MDRRIYLLGLGAFAVSTVAFLFSGLLPLIAEDIGVTVAQAGYLVTAYSMSYAVFTPVLAAITGRFNRRHVVVGALVAFIAGTMVTAFGQSIASLALAQILTGAAAGLFAATGQGIAVTLSDSENRAKAISMVVSGTTFAVALGAPLGSFLAHFAGWRAGFGSVGAVALLCLFALWALLPRQLPGARLSLVERLSVIRQPGVARLIVVTFIYMAAAFMVVGYFGPIVIDGAGMAPDMLPVVLVVYGIGAIFGNYFSGRLTDRIGARRMVIASQITSVVCSLVLAAILLWLPTEIAEPALMLTLFLWAVVGWIYPPAQISRLVAQAPGAAHLSLALHASAIYLGIAAGTFIGGRVLELAPVYALGPAAGLLAAGSLLMVLSERPGGVAASPSVA